MSRLNRNSLSSTMYRASNFKCDHITRVLANLPSSMQESTGAAFASVNGAGSLKSNLSLHLQGYGEHGRNQSISIHAQVRIVRALSKHITWVMISSPMWSNYDLMACLPMIDMMRYGD